MPSTSQWYQAHPVTRKCVISLDSAAISAHSSDPRMVKYVRCGNLLASEVGMIFYAMTGNSNAENATACREPARSYKEDVVSTSVIAFVI